MSLIEELLGIAQASHLYPPPQGQPEVPFGQSPVGATPVSKVLSCWFLY